VLLLAQAQEAAERHHGIGNPAADLLDHQPLDRADLVAIRIVDGRALDPIALDQRLTERLGRKLARGVKSRR
jgi:hypothetical protein